MPKVPFTHDSRSADVAMRSDCVDLCGQGLSGRCVPQTWTGVAARPRQTTTTSIGSTS